MTNKHDISYLELLAISPDLAEFGPVIPVEDRPYWRVRFDFENHKISFYDTRYW